MNMMEVCLSSNWVFNWNGSRRFPVKVLRWILGGRCSGFFGWKF